MATTKTTAKAPAKTAAKKKAAPKKTAKKAAPKKKATTAARKRKPAAKKAGEEEVTIDRRDTDRRAEEPQAEKTEAPKLERREKVNRRRQIDPTTCERDYSDSEVEFMNALDQYKRRSGRMFPTCSEVLEVIREIGYVQLSAAEQAQIRQLRGEDLEPSLESQAEADAAAALAESEELRAD